MVSDIGLDTLSIIVDIPQSEALKTNRDYVADAAAGALTYEGSGEGFMAMAKDDLARIDAAIRKAKGLT